MWVKDLRRAYMMLISQRITRLLMIRTCWLLKMESYPRLKALLLPNSSTGENMRARMTKESMGFGLTEAGKLRSLTLRLLFPQWKESLNLSSQNLMSLRETFRLKVRWVSWPNNSSL
jgi:hypothetical protein